MQPTRPGPGWYPDPWVAGGLRFWDGMVWTAGVALPTPAGRPSDAPPLDRAVAAQHAQDPRPWGWRPVVLPCIAIAVVASVATTITHLVQPRTFTAGFIETIVLNVLAYSALGSVVWFAGRDIAARYGGWGPAFGLYRPSRRDIGYIASGIGVSFVCRVVVAVIANGLTNGRAGQQSQNLRLHTASVPVDILLVVVVVLLAPVIEEIIFRGLLLRAFMRRLSFWPAALASTFIFAAFHTYEVNTLAGALTLAAIVATLGLTNCVLVRLTGRVTPGIVVHAAFNALAAVVIIYLATH
jgi:hypothetical protein